MITGIRLIGCQSWEDNVIRLSPSAVNVLKADNSSGKSVLFKMLKITACPSYYTPKERKKLIRYGHDSALILYQFDDGTLGGCRVFPTRVIYLYSKDGKTFTQYENPPQIMIDKLGLVHNGEKFIANIIDMDQPLLLVYSNVYENYELIKLLTENAELNEVREKVKNNISEFEEIEKDLEFSRVELEKALDGFEYKNLDKMEYAVSYAEKELQQLYQLEDIINILNGIKDKWVEYKPFNKMSKQLEVVENCELICKILHRMKPVTSLNFNRLGTEFDILNVSMQIKNSLAKVQIVNDISFKKTEDALDLLYKIHSLKDAIEKINVTDKAMLNKNVFTFKALDLVQSILTNLSPISICKLDYERSFSILQLLTLIEKIIEILFMISNTNKAQVKILNEIENLESSLENSGEVIECTRFGKVVYNGEECIHYPK